MRRAKRLDLPFVPQVSRVPEPFRLNLGCSDRKFPGFHGVDLVPPADIVADLSLPWPWDDNSVDEVRAHDVIEHVLDRIHFMNELWRVLKPGCRALIEVPDASKGVGYWCDPTHKSGWVLSSFKYFEDGTFAHQRLSKSYGIKAKFKVMELNEYRCNGEDSREEVWKIRAVLEAVKP
jgi:SAM-dependent methyltransferase